MITIEVMCPICNEVTEIQFPDDFYEDDTFEIAAREEPWPGYCKECEDRHGLAFNLPDIDALPPGPYTRHAFTSA
jgi:hypothetical protein